MSHYLDTKAAQVPDRSRHMIVELKHVKNGIRTKCLICAAKIQMDFRFEELHIFYCPCDQSPDLPQDNSFWPKKQPLHRIQLAQFKTKCTERIIGLAINLTEPCVAEGHREVDLEGVRDFRPKSPINACKRGNISNKLIKSRLLQTDALTKQERKLEKMQLSCCFKGIAPPIAPGEDGDSSDSLSSELQEIPPSERLAYRDKATDTEDIFCERIGGTEIPVPNKFYFKTRDVASCTDDLLSTIILGPVQPKIPRWWHTCNFKKWKKSRVLCDRTKCIEEPYLGIINPTDRVRYANKKFYVDQDTQSTIAGVVPTCIKPLDNSAHDKKQLEESKSLADLHPPADLGKVLDDAEFEQSRVQSEASGYRRDPSNDGASVKANEIDSDKIKMKSCQETPVKNKEDKVDQNPNQKTAVKEISINRNTPVNSSNYRKDPISNNDASKIGVVESSIKPKSSSQPEKNNLSLLDMPKHMANKPDKNRAHSKIYQDRTKIKSTKVISTKKCCSGQTNPCHYNMRHPYLFVTIDEKANKFEEESQLKQQKRQRSNHRHKRTDDDFFLVKQVKEKLKKKHV